MSHPPAPSSSPPVRPKTNIIIDSGAFSAWKLGKEINLDDYCDYLLANQDWITNYINLDRINPADPEAAAKESFANLKLMRKRGLRPMPVYHVGEDISWLHRILDLGCDYICVAALSMRGSDRADDFYSYVWSHLVDSQGLPIVKVHGLGEGRVRPLRLFPWASVDSTSWLYTAQRTGTVTLTSGQSIAMRNDKGSTQASPDLNDLSFLDRGIFDKLMDEHGVDPVAFESRDKTSTVLRTYLTAVYYKKMQTDARALHPVKFRAKGFLNMTHSAAPAVDIAPFNLYLVIGNNHIAWAALAKLNFRNVLASYYYISDQGGKVTVFKNLKDFVNNPEKFSNPIYDVSKNILEKYIKC